jgi:hypothetical protein
LVTTGIESRDSGIGSGGYGDWGMSIKSLESLETWNKAYAYGDVSPEAIAEVNQLSVDAAPFVGQNLMIP